MRSKASRHKKILQELDLAPSLRVTALARLLDVSTETVRRDLDEMTQQGAVNRTYGGATRSTEDATLHPRQSLHAEERQRMARATLPLLKDVRVLMIGAGATMAHLARAIAQEMSGLTVFTHSVTVAATLSTNPSIQVILAPGTYDPGEAAMVGAFATEFLGRLHADVALTGASGIGADGPSETQIDMAAIYTTMTRQCGRSIVLADQSKFGKIFSVCYVPWSHVDTLVADASPTPPLLDSLQAARVRLIQAH